MNISNLPKETKIELFKEALSYCFFAFAFRYLEDGSTEEINIYVKPLMNLFNIYNKFKKGDAQINLHYAVPIAEFKEPQKLIDLMNILTNRCN